MARSTRILFTAGKVEVSYQPYDNGSGRLDLSVDGEHFTSQHIAKDGRKGGLEFSTRVPEMHLVDLAQALVFFSGWTR